MRCSWFAKFLASDPEISPYSRQLISAFGDRFAEFESSLREEMKQLTKLRDSITKKYPDVDDSSTPKPDDSFQRRSWETTLACFDQLASGSDSPVGETVSNSVDPYADLTVPAHMQNILRGKLIPKLDEDDAIAEKKAKQGMKASARPTTLQNLWDRLTLAREEHERRFRRFINLRRTSGGQALVNLAAIARRLDSGHAYPASRDEPEAWLVDPILQIISSVLYSDDRSSWLQRAEDRTREIATTAYEGVRESIGRLGARIQIVERYKNRCMWHDAETLRRLAKKRKSAELELTRHLALWLFDQGIHVTTRYKLGIHEMDAVSQQDAILVEAKQYSNGTGSAIRTKILGGVAQLHAYMNNVQADFRLKEAYLVIFRLGGPLPDIPERIEMSRFTMIPVIVDVGVSKSSGSRQPKPIVITADDVYAFEEKSRKGAKKTK